MATSFDPSNTEELRNALTSGALIPPKTEDQLAALARLETTLALIEGWVDVVTAQATKRLPSSAAIAEMVRRRRASGGPAESAFATLVGLELRPRRLREAASMWQQITDAVGNDARDALWSYPDLVPVASDIDDPPALIARMTGGASIPDDIDRAIEDLLGDDRSDRPHEE
jgi:putative hydrolase